MHQREFGSFSTTMRRAVLAVILLIERPAFGASFLLPIENSRARYRSERARHVVLRSLQATERRVDASGRQQLLSLVQETPSGRATPALLTRQILDCVRTMEAHCPTPNDQQVSQLAGTWELVWTAQDASAPESQQPLSLLKTWINPLENQAYSNNPTGQANPFLPVAVQNRLEQAGWTGLSSPVRSTQSIDVKTGQIRNIVTVQLFNSNGSDTRKPLTATLTVSIRFTPDTLDARRINVKFDACRVAVPSLSIDWNFPLGWIGPTGWLRTVYLDDTVRVTRGHKGSVFVLTRPNRRETNST